MEVFAMDRYRVWVDLEATDEHEAERLLRDTLDKRPALVYGATGHETYNGWSNYETWAVNLWLTNDEASYHRLEAFTRQALADANDRTELVESIGIERRSEARATLAANLKEDVEANWTPDLGATLAADLLGAALSDVDWHEIAENHLDDEAPE